MAKQSALEKLIAAIPEHFLDQPCSDEHLREIGICITNWQIIAPHLNLSPADEEIIATFPGDKRIRMLRRWRQKRGSSATYRGLAASFQKVERADLIDKIRTLLPGTKTARYITAMHYKMYKTMTLHVSWQANKCMYQTSDVIIKKASQIELYITAIKGRVT